LVVPKKTGEKTSVLLAKIVVDDTYFEDKARDLFSTDGSKALADIRKDLISKDIATINGSLPSYMKIDDFEIMETDFKKNSSGKIVRKEYV
jgi:fructose-1-phosphate kinase PfkB-like protein